MAVASGAVALLAASCLPAAAETGWKPKETIERYAVSGSTGAELYRSIGENGPELGMGRVIAYTDFKLLWSRDYRPQPDGSCKLVSARPSLTITYRLPEARGDLPAETRKAWETFLAGIVAHEKVHGDIIVDMVKAIEATSVGLAAPNDPRCDKVRAELQGRLGALSKEQRARSRAFDKEEMQSGGRIRRLVFALVYGQ
jgi:predicted secreted Zn-dependent protease